jgi:hypothetical protein
MSSTEYPRVLLGVLLALLRGTLGRIDAIDPLD